MRNIKCHPRMKTPNETSPTGTNRLSIDDRLDMHAQLLLGMQKMRGGTQGVLERGEAVNINPDITR